MKNCKSHCGNCTPAAYEAHLQAIGGCSPKASSRGGSSPAPCTGPTSIKMDCSPPASPKQEDDGLRNWPREDKRRILHAVYRVGDIEKSMKWYQDCLGMHILRKRDVPEEKYMNVFMGFGMEDNHFAAELTYNYGVTKYDLGNAFGHFGIAVPNVQKTLDTIKKLGYKCPSAPAKERNDTCAFLEDPDGYKFKLLQRKSSREPFCQVSFRVADVDRSILYHQDVVSPNARTRDLLRVVACFYWLSKMDDACCLLHMCKCSNKVAYGMKLLARRDYPAAKKTFAYVGYDMEETRSTVLEFEYSYGQTNYSKGTGYAQLAIGTEDVYRTAAACELIGGGKTVTAPGALPKINTKIYGITDPDGWKTVWVDNTDFSKELEPASFEYQVKCTTNNNRQPM